jgi:hypothetical protein
LISAGSDLEQLIPKLQNECELFSALASGSSHWRHWDAKIDGSYKRNGWARKPGELASNSARDYYVEMQNKINKPIFVVGSRRSGTSILAWCLGHHSNLFPVLESSWMGEFATSVAIAYHTGAARGDHSNLSAMENWE